MDCFATLTKEQPRYQNLPESTRIYLPLYGIAFIVKRFFFFLYNRAIFKAFKALPRFCGKYPHRDKER
nr:hypothetical protein [uncultured Helicobacter sp.]